MTTIRPAATAPSRIWVRFVTLLALSLLLSGCGDDLKVDATALGGGGPEYVIGDNMPGTTLGMAADSLGGSPYSVPVQTNLLRLGVINGGGAANFRLALYTDDGGSPSRPSALVAATPPMALVAGPQEVAVSPTALAPGIYWILVITDAVWNIGDSGGTGLLDYRRVSTPFGSPLPNPIISPTGPTPLHNFNLWMVVRN